MENREKVSLLMPVYNVEDYLPEAMDSAMGQTLRDIEIICIDDGSTDSSAELLDKYAAFDKRIKVVHQENGGYGKAMNKGLGLAKGKYIAILEPDDFISCDMLENLYHLAEQYCLDFVKSDFAFLEGNKDNYQIAPVHISGEEIYGKVLNWEEKKELFRGYLAHWSCIYNRSFLLKHGIRFHESPGASFQDTGFWFQTMAFAQRIYLHDGCYYHYRQDNPKSSMLDKDKVYCIADEYGFIYERLKEQGILEEYWPQFVALCFIGHRDTLMRVADRHKQDLIEHIAGYFGSLQAEKRLDTSFMSGQDQNMLERILYDPTGFCQELIAVPEYLHGVLAVYDNFYIYGAGTRGKKIYKYLSESDRLHCQGFLVTKPVSYGKVSNQPVHAIDEVSIGERTGVIIGVTERYRQEIVALLLQRGITTSIILPEGKVP